jgi:hypothetical protein
MGNETGQKTGGQFTPMKNPRPATTRLSAYATDDEIAVAVARPKLDPTRMIYR